MFVTNQEIILFSFYPLYLLFSPVSLGKTVRLLKKKALILKLNVTTCVEIITFFLGVGVGYLPS
jgi:hypothetical protein